MDICIVNGSPKIEKSNSKIIIDYLIPMLEKNKVSVFNLNDIKFKEEWKNEISQSQALVLVFPLYADSIPSSLLRFLVRLEKEKIIRKKTVIYTVVNNGFFEGRQNYIAIEQIKNWSGRVKAVWGQGLGVGSGEILPYMKKVPLGKGPIKNLGEALENLCENIRTLKSDENIFINPNYPRILWMIQGTLSWLFSAKKNKVKIKDIF